MTPMMSEILREESSIFVMAPTALATASRSMSVFTDPGTTYCFRARTRDVAGNLSAWSTPRCTTVPVDDASLRASAQWDRGPANGWLAGTYSSARAKGATLTQRNLLMASLSYFADLDYISQTDTIIHAAPISHGSGLYGLPHIARGAVSVTPASGGVDGAELASLLQRWTGVTMFAAPTMVKRLANDPAIRAGDLTNLKGIVYGGAPMYLADLEEALEVFGPRLMQIYGQGETPMTITALSKAEHADRNHPRWREHMASVGFPRTDVEVRVVDEQDNPLPAGELGEVLVHGDHLVAHVQHRVPRRDRGPVAADDHGDQHLRRELQIAQRPAGGGRALLHAHVDDVQRLLAVFNRLVDKGNTIIVIEHNLDVIKSADWLIDLGPEGGAAGGHLLAVGTPEEIAALEGNSTGRFLQAVLSPGSRG